MQTQIIYVVIVLLCAFMGSFTSALYALNKKKTKKIEFSRIFIGWFVGLMLTAILTIYLKITPADPYYYQYLFLMSSGGGLFGYEALNFLMHKDRLLAIFQNFLDIFQKK